METNQKRQRDRRNREKREDKLARKLDRKDQKRARKTQGPLQPDERAPDGLPNPISRTATLARSEPLVKPSSTPS
jgi:hypothetical protein